jgi:hypothetical protein
MKAQTRTILLAAMLVAASVASRPTWAASKCEAACKSTVDRCLDAHPFIAGTTNDRICVECETECLRACQQGKSIRNIAACSTKRQ